MGVAVMIIMLSAVFGFLLRLTLDGRLVMAVWCAAAAIFIILTGDAAASQSKSAIAEWLSSPDLMLDTAVLLTADVVFQICFCLLAAKSPDGSMSRVERVAYRLCRWFPGLLIFPTLFAIHTETVFALTGVGFTAIAWGLAAALLIAVPILAAALKHLVPEADIRLEMIFMVNMLVAALGIVATVNGRTAAMGVDATEWDALACIIAMAAAGLLLGALCFKRKTSKKISQLQ